VTYDPFGPDGILINTKPTMRPLLLCPYCARQGHVQRSLGRRVCVTHTCPGPWTLEKVEEVTPHQAPYRVTFRHDGREPLDAKYPKWLRQVGWRTDAGR
jgi:hypothetical protein